MLRVTIEEFLSRIGPFELADPEEMVFRRRRDPRDQAADAQGRYGNAAGCCRFRRKRRAHATR